MRVSITARDALTVGLLLVFAAQDVVAQTGRYGAGWSVGGTYVTDLNAHAASSASGVEPTRLSPGLGYVLGFHLDSWFGNGRAGIRFQGSYQRPQVDWSGRALGIDAVSADVSALYRPLAQRTAQAAIPYLTAGVGGTWYDLERGQWATYPNADALNDGKSSARPMLALGVGVDTRPVREWDGYPVRARLELADHVVLQSPLRRFSDGQRLGAVHHVQLTVGMYTAVGGIR